MRNLNFKYLLFVICLFLLSCSNNAEFNEYKNIDVNSWHKDSAAVFNVAINDTVSSYNVLLHIRNNNDYKFQNLWLFAKSSTPNKLVSNDTLDCYLADLTGKWLGQKYFSINEMPILYMQNIRFPNAGIYNFKITHAMRDTTIVGIEQIGLSVQKITEKNVEK